MDQNELQSHLRILARDFGVHFMERQTHVLDRGTFGHDYSLAMDAQPTMITANNAGIPAYLTNYLDPQVVTTVIAPMKSEQIYGSAKKGDWTSLTTQFQTAEPVGESSSYGDFNNNGISSANFNWVPRQSYHFQTITIWGERELDMAGEARIDLAAQKNASSANTLNRTMNKINFFGIAGMQLYGALNDPSLPTALSPTGGTWSSKTPDLIFNDLGTLFGNLFQKTNGLVDRNTPMVLAMSPYAEAQLLKTNQYNVNILDQLNKNYTSLRIETAPEFSTTGGELVQLFVPTYDGVDTVQTAFTEKMRAHAVKVDLSGFAQKKSSGSWGTIWKRPLLVSQMLGV